MANEMFRLTNEGRVNVVELSLPQVLDSGEFDRLNDSLSRLFSGTATNRWVMDLSHLSYLGSSTLGMMVNVRQQVKASGGRLVLCGLSPALLQIFRTCCLERLFTIVRTRDEARREADY